jgi:hypothetical protein
MKKICALLIVSLMITAGTAFAGTLGAGVVIEARDGATTPYSLSSFAKMSTGVSLGYLTAPGTYAIVTKHVNGDKCYGAAANDGKNWWLNCDVGATAAAPSASDSSAFTAGWSSL